jgi:hypothetical protein
LYLSTHTSYGNSPILTSVVKAIENQLLFKRKIPQRKLSSLRKETILKVQWRGIIDWQDVNAVFHKNPSIG